MWRTVHTAHSSGSTGNLQSLNPYSSNREPCVDVAVHWCVVVLKVSIKTSTTLLVNCPTSVLSFGYLYWSSIFSQPRSQMKYSAAMYYHSLSLELHIPKYLGAPLDIKCFQKIIYRFTSFYFHTFYFASLNRFTLSISGKILCWFWKVCQSFGRISQIFRRTSKHSLESNITHEIPKIYIEEMCIRWTENILSRAQNLNIFNSYSILGHRL